MIKFPISLSVQPCSWSVVFHMGKMEHSKTLLMCCDYLITTWWCIDHSCKCVRPERQVVLGVWNDVSSYCVWKYAEMGDISDIFLFLLHLNMFIRRFAGFVHFQKWWKDCFHWKSVVETTKKNEKHKMPRKHPNTFARQFVWTNAKMSLRHLNMSPRHLKMSLGYLNLSLTHFVWKSANMSLRHFVLQTFAHVSQTCCLKMPHVFQTREHVSQTS